MADVDDVHKAVLSLRTEIDQQFKDLDQRVQRLEPTLENKGFIDKYGERPWAQAGKDVARGVDEIAAGVASIQAGDTIGGTSAILNGIGSLSGFMTLAGPVGAMLAGAMAVITSIVTAILGALKPAAESLEQKLEKLLVNQSLKDAKSDLTGARAAGNIARGEINAMARARKTASAALGRGDELDDATQDAYKAAAAGRPWLTLEELGWRKQFQYITAAFAKLNDSRAYGAKEWLSLFDLTIQCANEFWIGFEALAGLVKASERDVYLDVRKAVAGELQSCIDKNHFASLNEGSFYSAWISDEEFGWHMYATSNHNNLYKAQGVFGANPIANQENLNGQVSAFAVAASGTIFSVGYVNDEYLLCAGRNDADAGPWRTAPEQWPCQQVVIGEMADDRIKVVALRTHGTQVLVCDFNDKSGESVSFETNPEIWTAHDKRWENFVSYDIPDNWTMLSLAIDPLSLKKGVPLVLYGFGLVRYGGGNCCRLILDQATRSCKVEVIHEVWLTKDQIAASTQNVLPPLVEKTVAPDQIHNVTPCTVSCTRDVILVQVGNIAKAFERNGNREWRHWDLQQYFHSPEWGAADGLQLQCYQARIFEDQAVVGLTSHGAVLHYWNVEQQKHNLAKNPAIQSPWFTRQVAQQAGIAIQLRYIFAQARTANPA